MLQLSSAMNVPLAFSASASSRSFSGVASNPDTLPFAVTDVPAGIISAFSESLVSLPIFFAAPAGTTRSLMAGEPLLLTAVANTMSSFSAGTLPAVQLDAVFQSVPVDGSLEPFQKFRHVEMLTAAPAFE